MRHCHGGHRRLRAVLALIVSGLCGATSATAHDRCAGETVALMTAAHGHLPFVALAVDGRSGAFQLDYGTTTSSISKAEFSEDPTGARVARRFSLPTFETGRFALASYGLALKPEGEQHGAQLGIVGTDFLSMLAADFVFAATGGGEVVLGEQACDPAVLRRRGLVGVKQTGFFSSDPTRVRPGLPNVPVLPLRIGGLDVWAQIDTGYDDVALPPSIDINEALFRELDGVGLLRQRGELRVTTCRGVETRGVYDMPTGAISISTEDGKALRQLRGVSLLRKGDGGCGGIGTMPFPAAQLGFSVIRGMGQIVFDPKAEMVWIPAEGRATGG